MSAHFKLSELLCPHCGAGADIIKPELIEALEKLRAFAGRPLLITSGYRCAEHNREIGGAPKSAHMTGHAADVADPKGALASAMTAAVCERIGIWIEDPRKTRGWVHVQVRPATLRIFAPY